MKSGLRYLFHLGMECASQQGGKGKRNGKQKSGMVSKTLVGKLFARNVAFREMQRQCADRVMKTDYPLSRIKSGLDFKGVDGNGAFLRISAGLAQWKSEALGSCPRPLE
ncbi:hypothetical protein DSM02_4009 [Leeuwenhoekiella polynyae]|uniref:Uncharacterized protein n=4 Tax=Leeuwenhoekiella TaxID=283735 RepID=A0A4Q0PDX4_9FLAO|nr:hypothetical protein DSM02_4009 [Leeuwenhoekiella polynyae]RXG25074.1 hypothetical protein DSL99_3664 [Leeuwenhoekiella marinoflava]SHF89837.1 hypothetical protein SAMN02745246_03665 [Leeuwenhoekiella marinoflava DSM 3653]